MNQLNELERRMIAKRAMLMRRRGYEIVARYIERNIGVVTPLRPEENIRLNAVDPNPKPLG